MNITEAIQVYVHETTPADGRWMFVEANAPDLVSFNLTGRGLELDVTELRKLRAIVDHFIEAESVTNESLLAAIAAEFEG